MNKVAIISATDHAQRVEELVTLLSMHGCRDAMAMIIDWERGLDKSPRSNPLDLLADYISDIQATQIVRDTPVGYIITLSTKTGPVTLERAALGDFILETIKQNEHE